MSNFSKSEKEIYDLRAEKIQFFLENYNDAFPTEFIATSNIADIIDKHSDLEEAEHSGIEVQIRGRILNGRSFGKLSFFDMIDNSGKIQLLVDAKTLSEHENILFTKYDSGDMIGVKGEIMKTKKGQLSIKVSSSTILSKSLRTLPEKWHGLKDKETRFRQRYLDFIVNPDAKKTLEIRSRVINTIRQFMHGEDFIEVETPMMHPIPGGAVARPFVTKHNALDRELFLRIAPELYLKRLLVGGFERVFEINRSFRNEGLSTRHNPEFTMLEYYEAFTSLDKTIELTQNMIQKSSEEVNGTLELEWGEDKINLSSFRKANLADLVLEENKKLTKNDIEKMSGKDLLELFENAVEENLIQPTFVIGYPIEVSPLSRRNNENPNIADRFELFIGGKEFANGFCELNDPDDQAERFKEQVKAKDTGDKEAMSFDEDYVTALEHGMPPAVGVGIGIDRVVMMITNQTSIRDVILFPQLKS